MSMTLVGAAVLAAGVGRMAYRYLSDRRGAIALAEGQPNVQEGVKASRAGDWGAFEQLYQRRSPSDRYHFLRSVAELNTLDGPLPSPTTPTLTTIAAGLRLGWAWRHRGAGVGATVTARGAENMFRHLSESASILDQHEALDSVGRALRIRIEMGLEGNRGVLQRQLNAAETLAEQNIYLPINHLMLVAPKWHGSAHEILECARDYAARSSSAAWKALPAMAHVEVWLYKAHMSNSVDDQIAAREYYLESTGFRDELEAIDKAFWDARLRMSGPIPHSELVFAHNHLAYLCYRCSASRPLARHLEAIGEDLSWLPWGYSGFDIKTRDSMRDIRKFAGLSS